MTVRETFFERRRGFTLVELMVVVAIIAVLAAIGSYAYGRITKRSRINEAVTFFASLSGAQTAYYNHYLRFGATATNGSVSDADYDPTAAEIKGRSARWTTPDAAWAQIGIRLPIATRFQYLVVAGDPSDATCDPPDDVAVGDGTMAVPACASITTGTDWYYVVARADQDGDGKFSVFGSSSTMGQSHWNIDDAADLE